MKYYFKRLGHQELGSVKNGKAQRGRYIYISKDENVVDIFPPLSKTVTNDSSVIPIIPLYQRIVKKIYCNYIYHNDKYNVPGGTRDEYRLYSNNALEEDQLLFQPDDILIFRAEKASSVQKGILGHDVPEAAVDESKIYFLYRCFDKSSELYKMCEKVVNESHIRGKGHAIYEGIITEIEKEIKKLCERDIDEIDTVIEDTVTAKAQSGDVDEMANLFNSVSFRDFVMTGYKNKCAITGNVIRYGSFMNLEAAHIWPRSHKGLYLPSNGIALCRDMHWAFDKGMFTIDDCLFIYITHDTQFAAMHGNADKIWIQDYDGEHWKFKKIEDNDLPEELLLDILGNRNNVLFVEGEKNSFDVQLYGALYPSYHIIPCGSCSQVIERTKVFNNNPSLHNCKVYGIIDRDYRSDYEIEKYKENNIFTLNVAEVENLFITEELIRLMAEHMGKEANTTFEEIKKYVIHTRFSHQIESQICQSVVAQIKYKLSCVDISKQNSEKAKASLETAFKSINYEQVSSNETEKFQKILSEQNYADVIKVFNEKGIAKSIGQYFNIDNSSYCTTVISLLNGSKHNDIVAALLPYFPTEIPR